jgi:hypothetical protein
MSRPAPNILIEITNKKTQKTDQVIKSDGIWAIYYQGFPINLRTIALAAFVMPRYKTVSFSNKGHAINLAKKLNNQFNVTDFTVVVLNHAEVIFSE